MDLLVDTKLLQGAGTPCDQPAKSGHLEHVQAAQWARDLGLQA